MEPSNIKVSGSLLRNVTVLALARVEAAPEFSASWGEIDSNRLRQVAARLLGRHVHAAEVLAPHAEQLVAGIELVPFLEPGGPFGPAWSAHPLVSPAWHDRFHLREPDLTRELAALMSPNQPRGSERARLFLQILTEIVGATAVRDSLVDDARPLVTAEHRIQPTSRRTTTAKKAAARPGVPRIDLTFDWPVGSDGRRAVVAVEAKLGATVSPSQLQPYRKEAQRRARGGPVALVLLSAWTDLAEARNRAWRPVRWFALLRRWEAALAAAGDTDLEFVRVRAHLWRFVLRQKALA